VLPAPRSLNSDVRGWAIIVRRPIVALDGQMANANTQVSALISRYSPAVARQFRLARACIREYFPRGYELVFENYNALGCGYSLTDRGSGVVVSLVAYPRWVTLFFFHGIDLSDPDGILQGSGARIRSVRLEPFSLLHSSSVQDLILQATKRHQDDFAQAPRLATLVKSVATTRRPRRPAPSVKRRKSAKPTGHGSRRGV
jgi:hypothetical protein